MHTAARMAVPRIEEVKRINPRARVGCFGLYAPVNEATLRGLGVEHVIGGEFERGACGDAVAGRAGAAGILIHLERLPFLKPDREWTALSWLATLACSMRGRSKVAGYTEARQRMPSHVPTLPDRSGLPG